MKLEGIFSVLDAEPLNLAVTVNLPFFPGFPSQKNLYRFNLLMSNDLKFPFLIDNIAKSLFPPNVTLDKDEEPGFSPSRNARCNYGRLLKSNLSKFLESMMYRKINDFKLLKFKLDSSAERRSYLEIFNPAGMSRLLIGFLERSNVKRLFKSPISTVVN